MQNRFKRTTQLITSLLHITFQPTQQHTSKYAAARLKSSVSIDFTFPQLGVTSNIKKPPFFFSDTQAKMTSTIERHVQNGLSYFKNYKTSEALVSLDKAIEILNAKKIDFLSVKEKNLFAEALTCKAKIVQIGSSADQIVAFKLLDKALEILPNYKDAEECRNDMRADIGLPIIKSR
jgi:hypothetical protein